jgi:hypothetical protein
MIDFILTKMNLTGIINQIQQNAKVIDGAGMGKDELLFGTLNSEDRLAIPGGFTHKCIDERHKINSLTR